MLERGGRAQSQQPDRLTEEYRGELFVHATKRPANPHIYIPLINPDYHFLIGRLSVPWNKVTLPNELNLQFTIGAPFPPVVVFQPLRISPVWEPWVCQGRVVSLCSS